jgi:hypothetical protein
MKGYINYKEGKGKIDKRKEKRSKHKEKLIEWKREKGENNIK